MAKRKLTTEERRKLRDAFAGIRPDLGDLRLLLQRLPSACGRQKRTSFVAAPGSAA